ANLIQGTQSSECRPTTARRMQAQSGEHRRSTQMSHTPFRRLAAGALTAALASVVAIPGAWAQEPTAADVTSPHPPKDPLEFLQAPPKPSTLKGKFSLVGVGE